MIPRDDSTGRAPVELLSSKGLTSAELSGSSTSTEETS